MSSHDHPRHVYGVLTVEEMAERMKCTPDVVHERAVAGDLFTVLASDRADSPRYPAFQLDERLNKALLKKIIQECQSVDVSTTWLWRLLRTPQKFFSGFTPVEMLLGSSFLEYDALTPNERDEIFLEFVVEELSQTRL